MTFALELPVSMRLLVDFAKGWPLHLLTAGLFLAVVVIAPQQAGLLVYKGALIFGGAIGAYWVNRIMFNRPPARHVGADDRHAHDAAGGERTVIKTPAIAAPHHPYGGWPGAGERDIHADYQLCAMVCFAMVACAMAA